MIHKIKYFFKLGDYISDSKETIEEIKQEIREYKNKNEDQNSYFLIFKDESFLVIDKIGETVYKSNVESREFKAEEEINE